MHLTSAQKERMQSEIFLQTSVELHQKEKRNARKNENKCCQLFKQIDRRFVVCLFYVFPYVFVL